MHTTTTTTTAAPEQLPFVHEVFEADSLCLDRVQCQPVMRRLELTISNFTADVILNVSNNNSNTSINVVSNQSASPQCN